jgi:glycosyltransferase involved in cell wall biosynthesis
MDIICISTTDWDEIWGSRQQIMSRLAQKGHRVLYVERQVGPEHLGRDPFIRKKKLSSWRQPSLINRSKNLWLLNPPLMLPGRYYFDGINRANQNRLANAIHRTIEDLSFAHPVLWVYPPHSEPLVGSFNEILSIYHCIDYFPAGTKGRKRSLIEKQENDLLKRVDIIFTHAQALKAHFEQLISKQVHLLPSAADMTLLQSIYHVHPDIQAIPSPRIGIIGTFDARINSDILNQIALSHTEWHLLLVGRVRPGFPHLTQLRERKNIHFLGNRPYAEIPLFMAGCAIFLAPYVMNERTQYINPLKIYEYLATGKPVITSPLPEIQNLKPIVSFAENSKEFIDLIKLALSGDTEEKQQARRKQAQSYDWDQRVDYILQIIQKELEKK